MKKLSALAILACAGACAAPAHAVGYLKIDQHWYSISGSQTISYYPDARGLFVLDASATNCRRPGGLALTPGNSMLYYASTGTALPLQGIVGYRPAQRAFELVSATGDVICDGAVPTPSFALTSSIFSGGFEN